MKLKRPQVKEGPWKIEDENKVVSVDGTCIECGCPLPPLPYETADRVAIASIPEVMDRLEWIHELLSEEKSHPMTLHELEQTMLKMGYTEEKEDL